MSQSPAHNGPIYSSLADDEMMCELVEEFVAEIPERVETLRNAFASQDWDAVQRQAHQLKGAFGSYGFDEMTSPARALEKSSSDCRDNSIVIGEDLERLAALCERMTSVPAPAATA